MGLFRLVRTVLSGRLNLISGRLGRPSRSDPKCCPVSRNQGRTATARIFRLRRRDCRVMGDPGFVLFGICRDNGMLRGPSGWVSMTVGTGSRNSRWEIFEPRAAAIMTNYWWTSRPRSGSTNQAGYDPSGRKMRVQEGLETRIARFIRHQ